MKGKKSDGHKNGLKKVGSILTVAILCLSMCVMIPTSKVSAATLIDTEEGFETDTLGDAVEHENPNATWYDFTSNDMYASITVDDTVAHNGSRSLHVSDSNKVYANFQNFTDYDLTDISRVTFWYNATESSRFNYYLKDTVGTLVMGGSLGTDGTNDINTGTGWTGSGLSAPSVDTWNRMTIMVNYTDETFQVYDGSTYSGWYSTTNSGINDVDRFSVYNPDQAQNVFYDDINVTYSTAGSNNPPDVSNPSPSDGASGVSTSPTLSVDISDDDGDSVDVTFYDASDDSTIGTGTVTNSTASVTWTGLNYATTYTWYVTADDGTDTVTSSTWDFTTGTSSDYPGTVNITTLTSTEEWINKGGVKQVHGSYLNGLAIHQLTKGSGNPDNIFYVNEATGESGIIESATGNTESSVNAGGNVVFNESGYIYYTYGGRAQNIPFDLYRSEKPYELSDFTILKNNYETTTGSSTPMVQANGSKLYLSWREGGSTSTNVKGHIERYDIADLSSPEWSKNLGEGSYHETYDAVCIEQIWTRWDDAHDALLLSHHWFDTTPHVMGANPFYWSTDQGDTWLKPDGAQWTGLPLKYPEGMFAFDNIESGEHSGWMPLDVGLTPDGKPWMVTKEPDNYYLNIYDGGWSHKLTLPKNAYSIVSGANRMFAAYNSGGDLVVKYSDDNGQSWSAPYMVDNLNKNIPYIDAVIPRDITTNGDHAGFFYGYNSDGDSDNNAVKYASLDYEGDTQPGNNAPDVSNPSPSDDASGVSVNPGLSVDISDADGDAVTVTFYNASDSPIGTDTVTNATASIEWSGLSLDTNYSWYVIADDGINTNTSSTWNFTTTSSNVPPSIDNPSPSDGSTNVPTDTTLSVNISDLNGDSIDVTFYNADNDDIIGTDTVTNDIASTGWYGLSEDTYYSWYVVAYDGIATTTSTSWTFTTGGSGDNIAPSISNPSPSDGASGVSTSPTLSVDISDDDGDSVDVTFYDASDDSTIGTDTISGSGIASTTWIGLSSATIYNWYAIADDGTDRITSSQWSFTTSGTGGNNVPQVSNPEPSDGQEDVATDIPLSIDVTDDDGDTVTVSFYDAINGTLIGTDTVTNDTATVEWNSLDHSTTYEWFAVADDGTDAVTAGPWNFTTAGVAPPPGPEDVDSLISDPVGYMEANPIVSFLAVLILAFAVIAIWRAARS